VDEMHDGLVSELEIVGGEERPKDLSIKIGTVDITNQFTIKVTKDTENGNYVKSFSASANLKEITGVNITSATTIELTYKGKLVADSQEELVYGGAGNHNDVYLKYQRDPYSTGNPDGQTPEDTAVVFTYKGVINKVGANAEGNIGPLAGAKFILEKYYAGSVNDWQTVKTIGPSEVTQFSFEGLDAGRYRLTEEAPDGYYPIRPFVFEIVAQYNDNRTTNEPAELVGFRITDIDGVDLGGVLGLQINIDNATGKFETTILNTMGGALPTTGGMGTTLIYAAGGILVLAAIVLLVTKKRMSNTE